MRLCACCGVTDLSDRHFLAKYCFNCAENGKIGEGRVQASRAVQRAIRSGVLPTLDGLVCVDCGKRATCWEHRDYSRPLDVVPACDSCNWKRGPAANNYHIPPAQPAQSGVCDVDPSTNISCARHGTDVLSLADF